MGTISGKWKGTYTFVPEDGSQGRTKSFEMTIREEDDEEVSGEIVDISDNSQNPEKAKLSGFIMEATLSFVKQYPYMFFYNEKGELQIDESKPHPEIHYHGEIRENEISGDWDMEIGTQKFYGDYYAKIMAGTWQAEKVIE